MQGKDPVVGTLPVTQPGGPYPVGSTIVMLKSGFGRVFGPDGRPLPNGVIRPKDYVPGNAG